MGLNYNYKRKSVVDRKNDTTSLFASSKIASAPVGEMIILVKSNEGHLRPSPSTARKKVSLQASNDLFFYKTNTFFSKFNRILLLKINFSCLE